MVINKLPSLPAKRLQYDECRQFFHLTLYKFSTSRILSVRRDAWVSVVIMYESLELVVGEVVSEGDHLAIVINKLPSQPAKRRLRCWMSVNIPPKLVKIECLEEI